MNVRKGLRPLTVALIGTAVLVSGCSSVVGTPTADSAATAEFRAPGIKPLAPAPAVTVTERASGDATESAEYALSDVIDYWTDHGESGSMPKEFRSLPGPDRSETCDAKLDVARACGDRVIWEADDLEKIKEKAGDLGVLVTLAHEVGHHIQYHNGREQAERGADCLAAFPMQRVIAGESPRYQGNEQDVTNAARAAFTYIERVGERDPYGDASRPDDTENRMVAFEFGLAADSPTACFDKYPTR